jgi:hypothetical protein
LLEARRGVRDLLRRGVAGEKSGPKALLRVLATTVPAEIWLTEVRVEGSQLNISGKTLEPSAVNVWLDRLLVTGYLADKVPPSMRVERIDTIVPVSSAVPLTYSFNILTSLAAPFADGGAKP